jgi:TonB family protein
MVGWGGDLETRLHAILAPQPKRRATELSFAAISVLALLTCTASALSFRSEQQTDFPGGLPMKRTLLSGLLVSAGLSAANIGGSLFDPSGAAIPNAKASLYNPDTAATQETTTTSDGKFMFDGLPAGEYILRIEKPGFASLFREFNVQPDSKVERGLVLKLSRAQEQGNVQAAQGERAAYPQPLNPRQLRIGGEAQESKLIRKVQPVYPASAKAARVQGKVLLETVISAAGVPQEIRVISSPSDDLTQSALDAVRQWRYSSTLLNGTPVEVVTDVLVNYTLSY